MPHHLCVTCGTQYPEAAEPPPHCPICEDERQYVGHGGQRWTTPEALRRKHRNRIWEIEPGLHGIVTEPRFAIGQRALLIETPGGNVLWDCVSLLDDATVKRVRALGGIALIAISHPHYYSAMVDWADAFGAEIKLHAADRRWVMRPDERIRTWGGDTSPLPGGGTLVNTAGHYPGGTVLWWPQGAGGRGALLTGDILQVVADRRWLGFMYSYPNLIPLPATAVRRIAATVAGFAFDRIYGAFEGRVVAEDAQGAVRRSAERYLRALDGELEGMRG
jgi:glyoxylase-like metal-dependent hydrolase (beta-lactamase superfamily II)